MERVGFTTIPKPSNSILLFVWISLLCVLLASPLNWWNSTAFSYLTDTWVSNWSSTNTSKECAPPVRWVAHILQSKAGAGLFTSQFVQWRGSSELRNLHMDLLKVQLKHQLCREQKGPLAFNWRNLNTQKRSGLGQWQHLNYSLKHLEQRLQGTKKTAPRTMKCKPQLFSSPSL